MKKVLILSILLLIVAPFAYPSCGTLDILEEGLGGWTVGTAGSLQLHACCGTAPYTWSVSSGSFAPGVTMNSSGLISGTPTAAGYYFVCVKVTDAAGCTLTRCYFQEVN
ncbi:MAG: peptidase in kexin sedolisin [Acidobacteria bacterium]|nr:peptidase in kexin sedolisin [Acidobacteriota bacterium]